MKNSILIILCGFIILSCGNSEYAKKKSRIEAVKDSLANVTLINKQKEEARIDSIHKEEELKVVGDIKFGMNEKDFEKYSNEFKDKCKTGSNIYEQDYSIGGYYFESIIGGYYDKKLYYVDIIGYEINYDFYDIKMKEQSKALYSVFTNKYGSPIQNYGLPDCYSIYKGKEECIAYWTIGSKQISINVARGTDFLYKGDKYTLKLSILQLSINDQIRKEREEEEKEAIKKGTEIL